MRFGKNRAVVLGLVLVAVAAVSTLLSWSGDQRNLVRELNEEPELSVYVNESGKIQKMKLEEYIAAVVAGEMFPDWPVEAYAAQAIFARSFTMDFLAAGGMQEKYGADVSTSVEETQAFNPGAVTEQIKKGVEMTRGQVMTYENHFVRGWFHAYSGGVTARAKEGLDYKEDEPPFTKSVTLPDNQFVPPDVAHWVVEYSGAELVKLLATTGLNVGEISALKITERGPTGRVTKIAVTGASGQAEITGPEFRLAVDSTKMKSTLLDEFVFTDGVLKVAGRGYGHGVGLSQWDAYALAKAGESPAQIVQTFFQGTKLRKIYD